MQKYEGLKTLLEAVVGKEINEWVYSNLKKPLWRPLNATFYIFPEEEIWNISKDEIYTNDDGDELPKEYKNLKLSAWLEVADIEGVIDFLNQHREHVDIKLIEKALQFYYKNDAFME